MVTSTGQLAHRPVHGVVHRAGHLLPASLAWHPGTWHGSPASWTRPCAAAVLFLWVALLLWDVHGPHRTRAWPLLAVTSQPDMAVVAVLLMVGLPGLHRLSPSVVGILIAACAVCFLGINDIFKRLLLR